MKPIYTAVAALLMQTALDVHVFAQQAAVNTIRTYNFDHFTPVVTEVSDELIALTPAAFQEHPEFGRLPYNAPCTDCMEMLQERTASTRHFIRNHTNARDFLIQTANIDLSYEDEDGNWVTIDPRLHPDIFQPGIYSAKQQPVPTALNWNEKYSSIHMQTDWNLKINRNTAVYYADDITATGGKKDADNSDYSIGDDGVQVKNIWTGIDQQQIFERNGIKTNYIIHDLSSIDTTHAYFIIEDDIDLPDGYAIQYDQYNGEFIDGFWYGELILTNASDIEFARFDRPATHDADTVFHATPGVSFISGYHITNGEHSANVQICIPVKWLTDPLRKFPVTIDPLVTGTPTVWTGVNGSSYLPASCNWTVNVSTPANATLTNATVYWDIQASGNDCPVSKCYLNKIFVQISTSCATSPSAASYWGCAPGCGGSAGHWIPTLTDATLVSCFTPQCSSYTIPFTIAVSRSVCPTGVCATDCMKLKELDITIEGYTVEGNELTNSTDVTSYTITDCSHQYADLSANPSYGVPPYSYLWSDGSTGSTLFATPAMSSSVTYTLTITDACGNTVSDNVTITNPCTTLPIGLLSFTGYSENGNNYLEWTTTDDYANSIFRVERSYSGHDFTPIGALDAKPGQYQSYAFTDTDPESTTSYYRLCEISADADTNYSDIIAISTIPNSAFLSLAGENPVADNVHLLISPAYAGTGTIEMHDILGKEILKKEVHVGNGMNSVYLKLPDGLAAGNYFVTFTGNNRTATLQISHE